MIVYVESNFVLELAFQQEDNDSCDAIIKIAEANAIDLVIPAYCLAEPYERLVRRSRQRAELYRNLTSELRELSRSRPYSEFAEQFKDITDALLQVGSAEEGQFARTLQRLGEIAQVIPLEMDIMKSGMRLQDQLSLSPQDAIVHASILTHLESTSPGPKVFLNKNAKDFLTPDIQDQLGGYECRLITKFSDGLSYLQPPPV